MRPRDTVANAPRGLSLCRKCRKDDEYNGSDKGRMT